MSTAARLLTRDPISPKLKAASAALDALVATGVDELMSKSRETMIAALVRMYQSSPDQSRAWLKSYNLKSDRLHHGLGPDVHDRMIVLGIIDTPEGWKPKEERNA